jgi:hypothetical protein
MVGEHHPELFDPTEQLDLVQLRADSVQGIDGHLFKLHGQLHLSNDRPDFEFFVMGHCSKPLLV